MTHQNKHHDLAKRPSFNTKNELLTQGCGCKKRLNKSALGIQLKCSSENLYLLIMTKMS